MFILIPASFYLPSQLTAQLHECLFKRKPQQVQQFKTGIVTCIPTGEYTNHVYDLTVPIFNYCGRSWEVGLWLSFHASQLNVMIDRCVFQTPSSVIHSSDTLEWSNLRHESSWTESYFKDTDQNLHCEYFFRVEEEAGECFLSLRCTKQTSETPTLTFQAEWLRCGSEISCQFCLLCFKS